MTHSGISCNELPKHSHSKGHSYKTALWPKIPLFCCKHAGEMGTRLSCDLLLPARAKWPRPEQLSEPHAVHAELPTSHNIAGAEPAPAQQLSSLPHQTFELRTARTLRHCLQSCIAAFPLNLISSSSSLSLRHKVVVDRIVMRQYCCIMRL